MLLGKTSGPAGIRTQGLSRSRKARNLTSVRGEHSTTELRAHLQTLLISIHYIDFMNSEKTKQDEIVFLGSGGGRFVTIMQWRATGGFRLNLGNFNMHIDPGPGSLVMAKKYHENPQNVKCLLVSHAHPDHSTDANVMIEAMTKGTTKRQGTLIASKSVIEGTENEGPCISKYHLSMPKEYHIVKAGDELEIEGLKIEALKAKHRDPSTVGFKFFVKDKVISYTSDTEYFEELPNIHKGADILILNVLRPRNERIPYHLCPEDAVKILKKAKPRLAVAQHFGLKILRTNPIEEVKYMQEQSGIRVICASDGMRIDLEEAEQTTLGVFKK